MERKSGSNENDKNFPEIPDDASGLLDDIRNRADQRRRAIEINLENARKAETEREKDYWILKAMEFGDILDEYKAIYPELFPEDDPEDDSEPPS